MDSDELFSVLLGVARKVVERHPDVVKPLTSYLRSVNEDALFKGVQWLVNQAIVPSYNASPGPPPSESQISSHNTTYPDPLSYFTGLKTSGLKVNLLVGIAEKVLRQDHDEWANFKAQYDPEQGCHQSFWDLAQPAGIDSHTLVSRVVSFLNTDNKVRDKILKCILSKLIDKEEEKLQKNGVSRGEKYRTLARKATAPPGASAIDWGQKVKRHDLCGQKWRMFEPGCLIGFGGLAISSEVERHLKEHDVEALISWLRELPQYKEWTDLSPLATKLEMTFYNQQAQADTGLNSPCPGSSEAALQSSPKPSNRIPKPFNAEDGNAKAGDAASLDEDVSSTYVANTSVSTSVAAKHAANDKQPDPVSPPVLTNRTEEHSRANSPSKRRRLNSTERASAPDSTSLPDRRATSINQTLILTTENIVADNDSYTPESPVASLPSVLASELDYECGRAVDFDRPENYNIGIFTEDDSTQSDMMSDRQISVDHAADAAVVNWVPDIGMHKSAHIPEEELFLSNFMEEWR